MNWKLKLTLLVFLLLTWALGFASAVKIMPKKQEAQTQPPITFTDTIHYHPFHQIKIDATGQCYFPVDCPEGDE